MRLPVILPAALLLFGCLAAGIAAAPGEARDYQQTGQAFPIIEPDLLATIEGRLRHAEASGELARTNAMFAARAAAKVRRPDPVTGLSPARTARAWNFDPTVTIEREVRDQKGNLIAAAGQRLNPLDFVSIRQNLVFIDGGNAQELAWALSAYGELTAKVIFVNGSPIDVMTSRRRRIYFDQEGRLTRKFGIEHTPAVVTQAGKVMRVSEVVLRRGGAS